MSQHSETMHAAIRRLRRKLEIMRMDFQNERHRVYYDIEECYRLIEIIERKFEDGMEQGPSNAD